jgi:hypothetical protein
MASRRDVLPSLESDLGKALLRQGAPTNSVNIGEIKIAIFVSLLRVPNLGEATNIYLGYSPW